MSIDLNPMRKSFLQFLRESQTSTINFKAEAKFIPSNAQGIIGSASELERKGSGEGGIKIKIARGERKSTFSRQNISNKNGGVEVVCKNYEQEKRKNQDCEIQIEKKKIEVGSKQKDGQKGSKTWRNLFKLIDLRFEDKKKELLFLEEQLHSTLSSFLCSQLCLSGIFISLFIINIWQKDIRESEIDQPLEESITQLVIGLLNIIFLVLNNKLEGLTWRAILVGILLAEFVYLQNILFHDINKVIYINLGSEQCWNFTSKENQNEDLRGQTFEPKYQLLKSLVILVSTFLLLKNVIKWTFRLLFSTASVISYGILFFRSCFFWIFALSLGILSIIYLMFFYQEEIRQRHKFINDAKTTPFQKSDVNSPSLYKMIHEQLSSGLIIVQKEKQEESNKNDGLTLKFANKISFKQLNCCSESEILQKFKQISIPAPGASTYASTQQIMKRLSCCTQPASGGTSYSLYEMLAIYLEDIIQEQIKLKQENINNEKMKSTFLIEQKPQQQSKKRQSETNYEKIENILNEKKQDSHQQNKVVDFNENDISGMNIPMNTSIMKASRAVYKTNQIPFSESYDGKMGFESQNSINFHSKQVGEKNQVIQLNEGKVIQGMIKQKIQQPEKSNNLNLQQKLIQKVSSLLQPPSTDQDEFKISSQVKDKSQDENPMTMLHLYLEDNHKIIRQFDFKINLIQWNEEPALIILVTDSTEKLVNEKLKEVEMYKEELLYTMQHISRTPLNSIINISEILLSQYLKQYKISSSSHRSEIYTKNDEKSLRDLEDVVQNLHIIKNNGYILLHTINTVTDLSIFQTRRGQLDIDADYFSLANVLDEIKDLYLHQIQQKNLEFKVTLSNSIDVIRSDKKRVTQILFELIGNAIKYTQEGFIQVKIKEQAKGLLSIKVQDSGQGMSEEHKKNLFCNSLIQYYQIEKNFSKKNSAGLGLDFSRKLAGILGPFYQIFIKSAEKEGSTFKFLLFSNYDERNLLDIQAIRALVDKMIEQPLENEDAIFTPEIIALKQKQNNKNLSIGWNLNKSQQQSDKASLKKSNCIQSESYLLNQKAKAFIATEEFDEAGEEFMSAFELNNYEEERHEDQGQQKQNRPYCFRKDVNIQQLKNSILPKKYFTFKYDENQMFSLIQSTQIKKSQLDLDNSSSQMNPRKDQVWHTNFRQIPRLQLYSDQPQIPNSHNISQFVKSDKKLPLCKEPTDDTSEKKNQERDESSEMRCSVKESFPDISLNKQISKYEFDDQENGFDSSDKAQFFKNAMNPSIKLMPRIPSDQSTDELFSKSNLSEHNSIQSLVKFPSFNFHHNDLQQVQQYKTQFDNQENIGFSQKKIEIIQPIKKLLADEKNDNESVSLDLDHSQNGEGKHQNTFEKIQLKLSDNQNGDSKINQEENGNNKKSSLHSPCNTLNVYTRNKLRTSTQICQTMKVEDFDSKLWQVFDKKSYVLGVDDNIFNLNILEMIFKKYSNVIFHKAINGQDCLDKALKLKQEMNSSYKIFLMDIQMPIMDGYKANQELKIMMNNKVIDPSPVFAVTAYANEKATCLFQGMEGFVEKPINMKYLSSNYHERLVIICRVL